MLITFEISPPNQWRPGRYTTKINGKTYWRGWWLYFAFTYYFGSQDELSEHSTGWVWVSGDYR